jgi:hypothetical protein
MPKIETLNPLDYPNWDNLVLSARDYSFFHSSSWAKVLCESYHYTPAYFTSFDDGKLSALISVMEVNSILTGRRGVSLPFTDHCDPIIDDGVQFQDVFDHVIKYGKKKGWKFLELRGGQNLFPSAKTFGTYYNHVLSLSRDEQKIFSGFRDSTKRNVRKALAEGVKTEICNSLESMKEFYRLNCMTRKQHGLPPQPFNFFQKVHDDIISKSLGFVVLASHSGENIAGAVYFHFGDKAVYKYGASDRAHQHLRANNLVMWEAIKWYCQNGCKSFCFGRTEPENQGLRQFKTGWGTSERIINYYRYDLVRNAFVTESKKVTELQNRIFSKMPVPLLNIIGSALYRHMG